MMYDKKSEYESYTERAIQFLQDYSWIYNFKVTNLLSDNIIDTVPHQWKLFLTSLDIETFNKVFMEQQHHNNNIPDSILKFLDQYNNLNVSFQSSESHEMDNVINNSDKRGMGEKKVHEVTEFTNFLSNKITEEQIVDIGSGLGYLGEQLIRKGFSVTGVECSREHIARADKRKQKTNSHNFETLQINIDNNDSQVTVDNIIASLKQTNSISLIGLHCCGDLTPNILKMFLSHHQFSSLAVISCCYHKMLPNPTSLFQNFPMSAKVHSCILELDCTKIFNVFMMRLGAQETLAKWKAQSLDQHEQHLNNLTFRAVLEKVCTERNIKLVKKKRRGVLKSHHCDVKTFIESISDGYDLSETDFEGLSADMLQVYEENVKYFPLFELLTGLQLMLQSVIENLILLDRFLFLLENSDLSDCEIVELFDPSISPRNKVIFARK